MIPVYDVDGITIWHADCNDVLPTIDPADVGLLLTDPPYGIALNADYRDRHGVPKVSARNVTHNPVIGDDKPFDPAALFAFGRILTFGANYYRDALPPNAGGWLVWDKMCRNDVNKWPQKSDGELAWSNAFRGVKIYRHAWNGFGRSSENSYHVHPTQKPVVLMKWILEKWTEPGDLILDPYMGSGPIARACADLGRRYVGIEIVEEYVETAIGRLGQTVLDLNG